MANDKWTQTSRLSYCADASDLGISPGVHPAFSYDARDPWNRQLLHDPKDWNTDKYQGNPIAWGCTVSAPDGTTIRLTIFND